jgi:hypothetical protein
MATKKQEKEPKKSSTILKDRALIGKRNRRRGHAYEVKIVKELKEITGDDSLCTSRSESKRTDDLGIDIVDFNNTLPFYCQMKATQAMPKIRVLNNDVKDKCRNANRPIKPLVVFWSAQEIKNTKQVTLGEYCLMPKELLYELLTE